MLSNLTLEYVNCICRERRIGKESLPFGGLKMIFVGDFLQLPPVLAKKDNDKNIPITFSNPNDPKIEEREDYCLNYYSWKELEEKCGLYINLLTTPHRTKDGGFFNS